MDVQVILRTNEAITNGYQITLYPQNSQITVRDANIVGSLIETRHVTLDTTRPIKLRIFICGEIMELFAADKASITCRVMNHRNGKIAFGFTDGTGKFSNIVIRQLKA